MRYIHVINKVFCLVNLAAFLVSCSLAAETIDRTVPEIRITPTEERAVIAQTLPVDTEEPIQIEETSVPTEILSKISMEKIESIQIKDTYFPYFPAYVSISRNQELIAIGNLSGIRVINSETHIEVMEIEAELPVCQYGLESYIHFDPTGNFLAFTTLTGIEVWQVGGGRIYSAPYMHGKVLDISTCGLDVPQLALSPDGEFLAESGMYLSGKGYTEYFRVIDVLENSIVYQWNGNEDEMHGSLNTHPELGFSTDGSFLQTFLPEKFEVVLGNYGSAYKFWLMETKSVISAESEIMQKSINEGNLLFAVSKDDVIQILRKANGRQISQIEVDGCTWDSPCSVIFSPDGEKLAVLKNDDVLFYKRDPMITTALIYDVDSKELLKKVDLRIRDKNGVVLKNNGDLLFLDVKKEGQPTWWTQTAYFSGLKEDDGSIVFNPQVYDIWGNDPFYSGSCFIDPETRELLCESGVHLEDNTIIDMEYLENGFALFDAGDAIAQIKYPPGPDADTWQVRIKAYDRQTHAGYFCLDRNQREETCVIMDFSENTILEEQIDLYGFIRSQKEGISAFINREEKRLVLFDEDGSNLETIVPFEAVAFPVKPALFENGEEILYFVESLKTDDLFFDHVLLDGGKVTKRYRYEKLEEETSTAIAVHPNNEIWAIGDNEGQISFYDPETETVVFRVTASTYDIVDILFTSDGKQLYAIDQLGVISRWVIEK